LSAATEQAMKGSLSERHKERKEETWVSGTGFAWLFTFHANFFMKDGDEVCVWVNTCVCLPHCASLTLFRAK